MKIGKKKWVKNLEQEELIAGLVGDIKTRNEIRSKIKRSN